MESKNYRVTYQIKGVKYSIDFSIRTLIIERAHPDVNWSDITNISVNEIKVWWSNYNILRASLFIRPINLLTSS